MAPSVRCFPSLMADYMITQEAAGLLGFHPKSIRNLMYSKNLEAIKMGRGVLGSKKSVRE